MVMPDSTASVATAPAGDAYQELFGGAMRCCRLGQGWTDMSDLRPVPDAQEVFVNSSTNGTLCIEILAATEDLEGLSCPARYYFEDLASVAGSRVEYLSFEGELGVERTAPNSGADTASATIGVHADTRDGQRTLLFCVALRLSRYETDILITWTLSRPPGTPGTHQREHEQFPILLASQPQTLPPEMMCILRSLETLDFNLFA